MTTTTTVHTANVRSILRAIDEVLAVAEDDASSLSSLASQHRWAEDTREAETERRELKLLAGLCWAACAAARRALAYKAKGAKPHEDLDEAHTSVSQAHANLFHEVALARLTKHPVIMAQVWSCHSSIQALMRLFALARGKV
jgi:hypothetical protein